jgi:hypothetical protein
MTTPALAEHVRGKGRHYKQPETGELVPSVTNVLSVMGKGDVLMRWAAKLVAERAMQMKHALPRMEDNDIVDTLKAAPFNRSKRASERGTDIHAYLEARLNRLEPEPLSDDALPYKDAADDWFDYIGASFEDVRTEVTMFHPSYAGTTDLIGTLDGQINIVDFKTSKAIYDEAALQLSALAGCYTDSDGVPLPWRDETGFMSQVPRLVVVRIGADGWEEKEVADPHAGATAFFGLLDAWRWKHGKAYL